jgi:glycosyltransferase involved in cell wall biosynthesis
MAEAPPDAATATTITLAIIALNGEESLPGLLDSCKGVFTHIVCAVDSRTSDDTRAVLDTYAVAHEDYEWADDFSYARKMSFDLARKTDPDWIMWLDCDDVLVKGAMIHPILAHAPDHVWGVAADYKYMFSKEHRAWLTTHDRVRLVRADKPWVWLNRVHEVLMLAETDRDDSSRRVAMSPEFHVEHQRPNDALTFDRNIHLLGLMIDDDQGAGRPIDARVLHYVAQEYYHAEEYQLAAQWWVRYLQVSGWPEECYDALLKQAHCYTEVAKKAKGTGQDEVRWWGRAIESTLKAMAIRDDWCDAFYRMGMIACDMGRYEAALQWTAIAKMIPDKKARTQGHNELDYDYHPALYVTHAYMALQQPRNALDMCEIILKDYPGNAVFMERKQQAEVWLRQEELAASAITVAENMHPSDLDAFWGTVPKEAKSANKLREMCVPVIHEARMALWRSAKGSNRIVFLCGEGIEPWCPDSLDEGGLGGSETAVVNLARIFQARNFNVDVYNFAGPHEGRHDGAGYWDMSRYDPDDPAMLTVASRMPDMPRPAGTDQYWLWAHDLNYKDEFRSDMARRFDRIMPVSEFHANWLHQCYPWLKDIGNVTPTRNGIDLSRFADRDKIDKIPRKCIYTSSPDRGLAEILVMWPQIKQAYSDASLHIFYGFQNWDYIIRAGNKELAASKAYLVDQLERMKPLDVIFHGRVGQAELARHWMESEIWAYPATFIETSCISAMEAAAAGAVPITSQLGALPETIGDRGILLPMGCPKNRTYQEMFLGTVGQMLSTKEDIAERIASWQDTGITELDAQMKKSFEDMQESENPAMELRERGYAYASNFSWNGVADQWINWLTSANLPDKSP